MRETNVRRCEERREEITEYKWLEVGEIFKKILLYMSKFGQFEPTETDKEIGLDKDEHS